VGRERGQRSPLDPCQLDDPHWPGGTAAWGGDGNPGAGISWTHQATKRTGESWIVGGPLPRAARAAIPFLDSRIGHGRSSGWFSKPGTQGAFPGSTTFRLTSEFAPQGTPSRSFNLPAIGLGSDGGEA